jgi:hypothetical protein
LIQSYLGEHGTWHKTHCSHDPVECPPPMPLCLLQRKKIRDHTWCNQILFHHNIVGHLLLLLHQALSWYFYVAYIIQSKFHH